MGISKIQLPETLQVNWAVQEDIRRKDKFSENTSI